MSDGPEHVPGRVWALLGGWTPTYDGDLCAGGHPGPYAIEIHEGQSVGVCNRCGRYLDLRPCACGSHDGQRLARSFCPIRVRQDHVEVERMAAAGVTLPEWPPLSDETLARIRLHRR